MNENRLGLYRHGDAIDERYARGLMLLPAAKGWGVAQVGPSSHVLRVVCLPRATYAETIACETWALQHLPYGGRA